MLGEVSCSAPEPSVPVVEALLLEAAAADPADHQHHGEEVGEGLQDREASDMHTHVRKGLSEVWRAVDCMLEGAIGKGVSSQADAPLVNTYKHYWRPTMYNQSRLSQLR